jgi:hypothetical protein
VNFPPTTSQLGEYSGVEIISVMEITKVILGECSNNASFQSVAPGSLMICRWIKSSTRGNSGLPVTKMNGLVMEITDGMKI